MSSPVISDEMFSGASDVPYTPFVAMQHVSEAGTGRSNDGRVGDGPTNDGRTNNGRSSVCRQRYDAIVGKSSAIREVLELVRIVAPTDATVLIQGETGTGKELVARAIHECSKRASRPFVRLNCAAIPAALLESELFGHERGAFTGAATRKPGRFQMAHQGTLFLDEIGEIPLEMQAKLLRVLQEGEFEMLGSNATQKVNVRLVAATNANLQTMTAEKRFREDLYYRVHVFPITIPPLRERRSDIPLLIEHFVSLFATRMEKRIAEIPSQVLDALVEYAWPGNVRELQNLVERSVILSPGPALQVPLESLVRTAQVTTKDTALTMEDAAREHIIKTLEETRGVIGGTGGAAARLGMKRSTLYFRMNKLGIPAKSSLAGQSQRTATAAAGAGAAQTMYP
jgi:formate hydrogenlyase transcriptional activator